MSWVRIWVHFVFSTKNRKPLLASGNLRQKVFQHIKENAKSKGIWLEAVNGHSDHIHCLISLGKEQTLSKIAQLIKGESSFWINSSNLTNTKFAWQEEYWAAGVSESHKKLVKNYILNQEEHHRNKSFSEEVEDFMKKHGWQYLQN